MSLKQLGVGEVGQVFQAAAVAQANEPADDLMGRTLGHLPLRSGIPSDVVASRNPSSSRS